MARWARENDFDGDVQFASALYGVPVPLIKATIAVESQFNPLATNKNDPGWAWGLMQMIPTTATGLGYTGSMQALLTDPRRAIDLGTKLLAQNLQRADGVIADSVSAYNGGFRPSLGYGAKRADGTYGNQAYVDKILAAYTYFGGREAVARPEAGSFRPDAPPPARRVVVQPPTWRVIVGMICCRLGWHRDWYVGGAWACERCGRPNPLLGDRAP